MPYQDIGSSIKLCTRENWQLSKSTDGLRNNSNHMSLTPVMAVKRMISTISNHIAKSRDWCTSVYHQEIGPKLNVRKYNTYITSRQNISA